MTNKYIDAAYLALTGRPPLTYYERNVVGENFYQIIDENFSNIGEKDNMYVVTRHPILTTVADFVSKMFAQAEFWIEDSNGSKIENHPLLNTLKNPMYSLTMSDYLQAVYFAKIGYGTAVIHKRNKSVGFKGDVSLRLLNTNLIEFPTVSASIYKADNFDDIKVTYDKNGEKTMIPIKELIFFRDLPINLSDIKKNNDGEYDLRRRFISESRITGLRQTLQNTITSLEAKEIILKTNGKELFSSKTGESQAPLNNEEKANVEARVNNIYGVQKNRSRAIVTKAPLDWKSLHIAIRDLGLDESVKTDGNLIYTAFDVPRDYKSLDLKKASYQNQKESMASYMQNVMYPQLKDLMETLNNGLKDELGQLMIQGSYEHLPIMEFIKQQRFEMKTKQAQALKAYQDAGISFEDAIRLVGMDVNLKQNKQ